MNKIILITSFLLSFGFVSKAEISDPEGLFVEANRLYDSSNYEQALTYYETLIEEGIESTELYFNLGNTHYKLNNFPKSILFYEKANKLAPNKKHIDKNLEIARTKITDTQERTRMGFATWVSSFFGFSVDFWAWASIISLLFALIAFVVYKRSNTNLFKRAAQIKTYFFSLLFLLFVVVSSIKYNAEVNSTTAIVMEPSITIKTEPNRVSENAFVLHEGSKVVILSQQNNWSEIRFGANEGWIEDSNIEKI